MKLKMSQIIDRGTLASEKVLMEVLEDTNLINYILKDTTYLRSNVISNTWVHTYEFLKQTVNKGDKVILFTGEGLNKEKQLPNGSTEYTYYWGLDICVWNNDGDAAVLYEISDWQHIPVNKKIEA